ncbi:hypothetical protein WKR88_14525 [Trinickia caryophylli]|nr:hypothetical protein [Trinickia caryophylli]TRX14898.1 hypothetical protein FNF07_27155 [Trinickia caryophylli]WQE14748.1 hypothetical protein U0034_19480 [Trinickia caryophylli]
MFVEPLMRGDRISLLAQAVSAAERMPGTAIFIVTRTDYACSRLVELRRATRTAPRIVASALDLRGAEMAALVPAQIAPLLDACEEVVAGTRAARIVFLDAGDYLQALAAHSTRLRSTLGHASTFIVERAAAQPSVSPVSLADDGARENARTALRTCAGARFIIVGDRAPSLADEYTDVSLPDAWRGRFSARGRAEARALLGAAPSTLLLAAVARSDEAGKDDNWQALAQTLLRAAHARLLIVGGDESLRRCGVHCWADRFAERIELLDALAATPRQFALIAAADIVLTPCRARAAAAQDIEDPTAGIWLARTAAFGATYDDESAQQIAGEIDAIERFSAREMSLLTRALGDAAQRRLLNAFETQFIAAISPLQCSCDNN